MQEVKLRCPKCGRLLLEFTNGTIQCWKCKKEYLRDSLFCHVCMSPIIQVVDKLICSDPQCPSHSIGLPCYKFDCKDYDPHSCIMVDVFIRNDCKVGYRVCYPKKCFSVEYKNLAQISKKELSDIFAYSKDYKLNFIARI